MINITFPDGSVRQFEKGVTGHDIARSLSNSLAREVLSINVNDELWDIGRPIEEDAAIKLNKWDDDDGKHAFWHSSAHLMAEAIESLYPGTKFGIGPAIENGFYYDVDTGDEVMISDGDLARIEQKMKELASQKLAYQRKELSKKEAMKFFGDKGDDYKTELIGELEDGTISFYHQGNFTDLCRGPHLPDTSPIKAIKLLSVAGAYWRGDETRKQLTRIYGVTFPKAKMLEEHLELLEQAKLRDHRKLGKELELFTFSQRVGPGLPLWLPKGAQLRERLENFLKKVQRETGYEPVITPHIGQKELWVTSGHYAKYGKDSFQPIHTPQEGEEFLLKPMNCPAHCEIYKSKPRSYKELPVRLAEFGTVYRYEQSGELHGLTRVRGFTQDDAHIFCRPDQLKEEFLKVIDIILYIFKTLDFKDFTTQVSLRDPEDQEKYIGTDENWEKAEQAILEAVEAKGMENVVVEYGEAAFYGPKLDFIVKDALGRKWQLGTIQVDYNLPERFELEYIGSDNQKHQPVMIHRAPFGSMERFVAVLIEHTAGKFPLWLTPDQAVILPISEKYHDYAEKVSEFLKNYDIRTLIDERNEKIGKKIRDNELKRIPYLLIVGEKEQESGSISVRRQGEGDKGVMSLEEFANFIQSEVQSQLDATNTDV
ncbi:MAG: threonine--tRNA ligase [Bacteroidales bacterium]|nr:threonine--tRNA ligase [Bacteroidales bacterium]